MRSPSILSLAGLALSTAWLGLGALAAPIETAGPSLTLEDWDQVQKGTW